MKDHAYDRMLSLVKYYHPTQTRDGGTVPYWTHCDRVAELLRFLLGRYEEGSPGERTSVPLAALGHDLYEDTEISRHQIVDEFGAEVDQLIEQVTNRFPPGKIAKYVQHLTAASEEARLIKLADLCDNYWSSAYALARNGLEWTQQELWPVLEPQWQALKEQSCEAFPRTAQHLKQAVELGRRQLLTALEQAQAESAGAVSSDEPGRQP
jgi:(p)ppGpp synthase/HD superfamily hydrolase